MPPSRLDLAFPFNETQGREGWTQEKAKAHVRSDRRVLNVFSRRCLQVDFPAGVHGFLHRFRV